MAYDKFTVLQSSAYPLSIENVDTDQIIPARFLKATERKGFGDNRGNHFFRMLDFIDIMRPKVIFFENVKNLLGHDKGNTFKVNYNLTERQREIILAGGLLNYIRDKQNN